MIQNVKVQNFKSIKDLSLEFGRVNIFIGEPNTGKSNILESIGILSSPYTGNLHDFVRFENMSNLFYDNIQSKEVIIQYNKIEEDYSLNHFFNFKFTNGKYVGKSDGFIKTSEFNLEYDYNGEGNLFIKNSNQIIRNSNLGPVIRNLNQSPIVKFYKFKLLNFFNLPDTKFLVPPYGENLLQILLTNENLFNEVSELFENYGYKILFRQHENKIEIAREEKNKLITHPYSLVADTLQRMVFYLAAIETNNDSVLIFEEPESFAFPFYTKQLAEKIGKFNNNQFFISTHNPYFLTSIVEKTPSDDIRIFVTSFSDYQTRVKSLTKEELTQLVDLDSSVFFNLDKFIETE